MSSEKTEPVTIKIDGKALIACQVLADAQETGLEEVFMAALGMYLTLYDFWCEGKQIGGVVRDEDGGAIVHLIKLPFKKKGDIKEVMKLFKTKQDISN